MSLDGFMFRALVGEIQPLILGARVQRIYQPDDYSLALELYGGRARPLLLLSAHPRYPSLHLDRRGPGLTGPTPLVMLLRKHLPGARVTALCQHGWDRVLRLTLSGTDSYGNEQSWYLVLEVLGTRSDVMFIDQAGRVLESLRRRTGRIAVGEAYSVPGRNRLSPDDPGFEQLFLDRWADLPADTALDRAVFSIADGPGPLSAREIVWRAGYLPGAPIGRLDNPDKVALDLVRACTEMAADVKAGNIVPSSSVVDGRLVVSAFPLEHLGRVEWESFPSAVDLARATYHRQRSAAEMESSRSRLESAVSSHLKRARRKLQRQEGDVASAGNPEEHRHLGQLLTSFMHLAARGASTITVPDYNQNGQEVTIALDPRLTPSENAQEYFRRYRRATRARDRARQLLSATRSEIEYLETLDLAVETAETAQDLGEIEAEMTRRGLLRAHRRRQPRKDPSPSAPRPLIFRSPSGRQIAVGKNNRQNDYVTFRWAEGDDLWFHVKDVPGSHVVLKTGAGKPLEGDIEAAAILAAYYSRARQGGNVPVDYTRVSRVRKQTGAGPGKVTYTGHSTVFVTPDEDILPDRWDDGENAG